MKRGGIQHELAVICTEAFNLASQSGNDPFRLERERWEAEQAASAAREFERRMQRLLEECPGFTTCEAPRSEDARGKVIVEPARITEAMQWLKRRFVVNESLELSTDIGLCVELIPRKRGRTARTYAAKFKKPEQFALPLPSN
jgi:hypothetical protein